MVDLTVHVANLMAKNKSPNCSGAASEQGGVSKQEIMPRENNL